MNIPLLAKPRGAETRGAEAARRRYPLARWEEAVLAAAFAAAFFTFRGLYGAVPFLLALGLAAILAYAVLLAVRLATRANLANKRFPLKRAGKLLPARFTLRQLMAGNFCRCTGYDGIVDGIERTLGGEKAT